MSGRIPAEEFDGLDGKTLRRLCLEHDLSLTGNTKELRKRLLEAKVLSGRKAIVAEDEDSEDEDSEDEDSEDELAFDEEEDEEIIEDAILDLQDDEDEVLEALFEIDDGERGENTDLGIEFDEEVAPQDNAIADETAEEVSSRVPSIGKRELSVIGIVFLLLSSTLVVWWFVAPHPFTPAPLRWNESMTYAIENGQLRVEGDEVINLVVEGTGMSPERPLCREMDMLFDTSKAQIQIIESHNSSTGKGSSASPTNSAHPGASWVRDGWGRWHLAMQQKTTMSTSGSIEAWVKEDAISGKCAFKVETEGNIDLTATTYRDLSDEQVVRISTEMDITSPALDKPRNIDATIFGSDNAILDLLPRLIQPVEPITVADLVGSTTEIKTGANGTANGWRWEANERTEIIEEITTIPLTVDFLEFEQLCIGRLRLKIWVAENIPWAVRQEMDMLYEDDHVGGPECGGLLGLARSATFPEGTISFSYTLRMTSHTPGTNIVPKNILYLPQPSSFGIESPSNDWGQSPGHMPDGRSGRMLNLDKAIQCNQNNLSANDLKGALDSNGYVWKALENRSDNSWNISWVKGEGDDREAGYTILESDEGKPCRLRTERSTSASLAPPTDASALPETIDLKTAERRLSDDSLVPDLTSVLSHQNGSIRTDVKIGYVAAGIGGIDLPLISSDIGFVSIVFEREWTDSAGEHHLRGAMDGTTGQVVAWVVSSEE